MLIVSKFHDYYDSAATYGIDKTVVYKREMAEKPIERYRRDIPRPEHFDFGDKVVDISFHLIGFCGKVYPAIKFEESDETSNTVYAYEYFESVAASYSIPIDTKAKLTGWSSFRYWRGGVHSAFIKQWFNNDWTKEFGGKFVELHQPVFVINSGDQRLVLLNGYRLKDFNFAKVKDPATAFQELYMFIDGVLGQPKDIPSKQTDKEKAASHGHDGPYSFKRPPGGKKWR